MREEGREREEKNFANATEEGWKRDIEHLRKSEKEITIDQKDEREKKKV